MTAPARPGLEFERRVGYPGSPFSLSEPRLLVVGVDEVGRGCLAGEVVAAAVVVPRDRDAWDRDRNPWISEITDSKLVGEADRRRLSACIQGWAEVFAIAQASVEEIDRFNILRASHLAMERAVEEILDRLTGAFGARVEILVDGNLVPRGFGETSHILKRRGVSALRATAIVKGDQKSISIACASILAKVWRDERMVALDRDFPGYGIAGHKGYPTPAHQRALRGLGPSPAHRRTFGPVAAAIAGSQAGLGGRCELARQ